MNSEELKKFRNETQYGLAGKVIKAIQFRELKKIDFAGKTVLEIGAGAKMDHIKYWNTYPKSYTVADIDSEYLDSIKIECTSYRLPVKTIDITESWFQLFFGKYDIVMAFNVLEHVSNLDEKIRLLRNITIDTFIASIPAEGGLMWELGRRMFSRHGYKILGVDIKTGEARQQVNCSRCIEAAFIRNWPECSFEYYPFPYSRNLSMVANIKRFKK